MKGFNQISYAVDNFPTQSSTDTGQNVYNPVEGIFIISTRSSGFDGYDTPIYLFPNQNYVDDVLWSFTNLEMYITSANISSDTINADYDFLARVYCTRKLDTVGALYSISDYEIITLEAGGVSSWDLSDMLSFNSFGDSFELKLGVASITNLGLYKGTFILF